MPAYEFTGLVQMVYPESRDANGKLLGTVDPEEIRFFDDAPPDHLWVPANGDGIADAGEDELATNGESAEPVTSESAEAGTPEGDAPAPEPEPDEHSAF